MSTHPFKPGLFLDGSNAFGDPFFVRCSINVVLKKKLDIFFYIFLAIRLDFWFGCGIFAHSFLVFV